MSQARTDLFCRFPEDIRFLIFSLLSAESAASIIPTSKNFMQYIHKHHKEFQQARLGQYLLTNFYNTSLKKVKVLPDWLPKKFSLTALILIGKKVIDLDRLLAASQNFPLCFFKFVFDENILVALNKGWVTMEDLLDKLALKQDPRADDIVEALFASEEVGLDLVERFRSLVTFATQLVAQGQAIDESFINTFLTIAKPAEGYHQYFQNCLAQAQPKLAESSGLSRVI